ncbi:hypothetical protein BT69DRAFT_1318966 [Atractiella rhizophila]|nr:hypothetical protein BT69DRAFT_1318966 [Atractiella rhizophila]
MCMRMSMIMDRGFVEGTKRDATLEGGMNVPPQDAQRDVAGPEPDLFSQPGQVGWLIKNKKSEVPLCTWYLSNYKTVATLSYSAKLTQKANQRMKEFQEDEDLQPNIWFSLPEDPLEIYHTGCSVAVECIFSGARDTIGICRTRLKPNTIQSLVVLKAQL